MSRRATARSLDLRTLGTGLAGLLFGAGLFGEMPAWITLVSLSLGVYLMQHCSFWSTLGRGAVFGASAYAAAGWWVPAALVSLGVPRLPAACFWGVAVSACGAAPFAILGIGLYPLRRFSIAVATTCAGLEAYLFDSVATLPAVGLPILSAAYPFSESSGIAQLAAAVGTPGVSAFVVALAYSLSRAEEAHLPLRVIGAAATSWLALSTLGLSVAAMLRPESRPDDSPAVTLLLIQPQIPREERWRPEMQHLNLEQLIDFTKVSAATLAFSPDAVVWPENTITTPLESDDALKRSLLNFIDRSGLSLISGLVRTTDRADSHDYRSSALWMAPKRGVIAQMDKSLAIPILESSRSSIFGRILRPWLGDAALWNRVKEAPLSGPLRGEFEISPLLCYEVLFPEIAARRRSTGSVLLLNLADDGWAASKHGSRLLARLARFRAIEQRLPLARLSQGGGSVVFDELGQRVAATEPGRFASLVIRAFARPLQTLGERVGLLLLAVVPGGIAWVIYPWIESLGLRGFLIRSSGSRPQT